MIKRMAAKLGLSEEEIATELEKGDPPTFAGRIAQRELDDELPDAMDVLRSVIWGAFYPPPDSTADPIEVISTSLDEFKAWCLDLLDRVPVAKRQELVEEWELSKALPPGRAAEIKTAFALAHKKFPDGVPKAITAAIFKDPAKWLAANGGAAVKKGEGSSESDATVGNMSETEETRSVEERVETIEKSLKDLPETITAAVKKASEPDPETPSAESVAKQLDEVKEEFGGKLDSLSESIAKLAEGGTTQSSEEPLTKSEQEKIDQIYKDAGLDPNLAGIL